MAHQPNGLPSYLQRTYTIDLMSSHCVLIGIWVHKNLSVQLGTSGHAWIMPRPCENGCWIIYHCDISSWYIIIIALWKWARAAHLFDDMGSVRLNRDSDLTNYWATNLSMPGHTFLQLDLRLVLVNLILEESVQIDSKNWFAKTYSSTDWSLRHQFLL